jgi:hypothetical protein
MAMSSVLCQVPIECNSEEEAVSCAMQGHAA